MAYIFYPHELPALIAAHERESKVWLFHSKKSREGHKKLADEMRGWLTTKFPSLSNIPFEGWKSYLVRNEHASIYQGGES